MGAASIYGMLLLYRESAALASVNFFGTSLRYAGKFVIIWESENEVTVMKKHPLLAAGAAAGTAVLGAAYAVYRVAFTRSRRRRCPPRRICPRGSATARPWAPTPMRWRGTCSRPCTSRRRTVRRWPHCYYHHADGAPAGNHLPRLPRLCGAGRPGRLYAVYGAGLQCAAARPARPRLQRRPYDYDGREGALRRPRLDGLGSEPLRPEVPIFLWASRWVRPPCCWPPG